MPIFVRSDILLLVVRIAQRDLRRIFIEAQRSEDIEHDIDHLHELILQLIGTAEDVGIVLSKSTDTCQSMQLTALFVPIDRSEFGETQRQILV